MRRIAMLLAVLPALLSACGREPTPEERAAEAARAIALVEKANRSLPPLEEVTPDPILYPDIERYGLDGAGCNYAPGTSLGTRVIAREADAFMKIDGEIARFSADSGAREMPLKSRSRYLGRDYELNLSLEGEGEESEMSTVDYQGTVTLRDEHGRIVYEGTGLAQCGS